MKDNQGFNAIHYIVDFRRDNILQFLLIKQLKWNLEARTTDSRTPITYGGTAHKYYDATCRDLNFTTLCYNHNAPPKHKNNNFFIIFYRSVDLISKNSHTVPSLSHSLTISSSSHHLTRSCTNGPQTIHHNRLPTSTSNSIATLSPASTIWP